MLILQVIVFAARAVIALRMRQPIPGRAVAAFNLTAG